MYLNRTTLDTDPDVNPDPQPKHNNLTTFFLFGYIIFRSCNLEKQVRNFEVKFKYAIFGIVMYNKKSYLNKTANINYIRCFFLEIFNLFCRFGCGSGSAKFNFGFNIFKFSIHILTSMLK